MGYDSSSADFPVKEGYKGRVIQIRGTGNAEITFKSAGTALVLKSDFDKLQVFDKDDAAAKLPPHLRLGIALDGIAEWNSALPSNAVDRTNASIPREPNGELKYPTNDCINGYVNQSELAAWCNKRGAYCELLEQDNSPHIGRANIFVSWHLGMSILSLVDALDSFLENGGLSRTATFFWVCDFVVRHHNVAPDLKLLSECVTAVGHTVFLLEPSRSLGVVSRAYCVKELLDTDFSFSRLTFAMSKKEREDMTRKVTIEPGGFHNEWRALVSSVDVSKAKCRNEKEQASLLRELDDKVGFGKCNATVRALMWEALAQFRPKGSSAIVSMFIERLDDEDTFVRKGAVEALCQVAAEGDEDVISAVSVQLLDSSSDVRNEAVRALPHCASPNKSTRITSLISQGLAGGVEALSQVVNKGDRRAIQAITKTISDPDHEVRDAAVGALAQVSDKGNKLVISALTRKLTDKDPDVRKAAVRALSQVADRGNTEVIEALTAKFMDADSEVREAATIALNRLVEKGDKHAVTMLVPLLNSKTWYARGGAVQALSQIAKKGDRNVINAVAAKLSDETCPGDQVRSGRRQASAGSGNSQRVRAAAAAALGELARRGDRHAIRALRRRQEVERDGDVREAISNALLLLETPRCCPIVLSIWK